MNIKNKYIMKKKKISLKQIIQDLHHKKTIDDKILFLCYSFRHLTALKLKNFYLYSIRKESQFKSSYWFLLGVSMIFLISQQRRPTIICLITSMFLYFSPILAKKMLEKIRQKAVANSQLPPSMIRKYHSDYRALRVIKKIINPFNLKRLS